MTVPAESTVAASSSNNLLADLLAGRKVEMSATGGSVWHHALLQGAAMPPIGELRSMRRHIRGALQDQRLRGMRRPPVKSVSAIEHYRFDGFKLLGASYI